MTDNFYESKLSTKCSRKKENNNNKGTKTTEGLKHILKFMLQTAHMENLNS